MVIKAKGGLGNRMLSAVTGIALAGCLKRKPVIDWRDGMYLPIGINLYPKLFEDPIGIDVSIFDDETDVHPSIWSGKLSEHPVNMIVRNFPKEHSNPFIYRKLCIPLNGTDAAENVAVFWSYLPKMARISRMLRRENPYSNCSMDEVTHRLLKEFFTPKEHIRSAVEAVFAGRSRPVIGVHIRFTDRKVPLEKIEHGIRTMRARLPQSDIFLATDSSEARQFILARFDRVFENRKEFSASGLALHGSAANFADPQIEAENAVIDMFALANCDWLVHSRHSTYSVAASLIGNIPATHQIDVDRWNLKVITKRYFQAYA